jgi:hypothetical protein
MYKPSVSSVKSLEERNNCILKGWAETPEYKLLTCLLPIPTANTVGILWNVSVDFIVVKHD